MRRGGTHGRDATHQLTTQPHAPAPKRPRDTDELSPRARTIVIAGLLTVVSCLAIVLLLAGGTNAGLAAGGLLMISAIPTGLIMRRRRRNQRRRNQPRDDRNP